MILSKVDEQYGPTAVYIKNEGAYVAPTGIFVKDNGIYVSQGEEVVGPSGANYNYRTPTTGAAPVAGELVHADNVLTHLLLSKTTADGATLSLDQILVGDFIMINNHYYIVQRIIQYTDYTDFTVDSEVQQPEGQYMVTVLRPI